MMRFHRKILLAGLMAMGASGCANQAASEIPSAANAPVIRVVMTRGATAAGRRITVDGKEVKPPDLADALRALRNKSAPGEASRGAPQPAWCAIQMPADAPYEQLVPLLVAAAQADIKHVRLASDATGGFDYTMPAIDSAGRSPMIQATTELTRKGGDTWVSPPGEAPVRLTRAGAVDSANNAEILNVLKRKSAALGPKVQMVLRPAVDVPFRDVITVSNDCVRARFSEIAFAAPPGVADSGGPASAQARQRAAPARVTRVVYIIDCSASVADAFAGLKREIGASADRLLPAQRFDVVLLSDKSAAVFPEMQNATPEIQRKLAEKLDGVRAAGDIEGKLQPFQDAFAAAFAMQPQMIYFLTESAFDPKLLDVVDGLNKDHKVQVNTLALVRGGAAFCDPLKEMARRNGGLYKFVAASAVKDADAGSGGK